MNDSEAKILNNIWITRGSRFNASKRFALQSKLSTLSISIWSGYIIILSFITLTGTRIVEGIESQELAIITISLSILILVFSLIESGNNYSIKSSKIHDCAVEISRIYDKLNLINYKEEDYTDDFKKLIDEYHIVISKYDYNHNDDDWAKFKATYPQEFGLNKFMTQIIHLSYYFKLRIIYLLFIIGPIIYFIIRL